MAVEINFKESTNYLEKKIKNWQKWKKPTID